MTRDPGASNRDGEIAADPRLPATERGRAVSDRIYRYIVAGRPDRLPDRERGRATTQAPHRTLPAAEASVPVTWRSRPS
jgi:hypothetical protein